MIENQEIKALYLCLKRFKKKLESLDFELFVVGAVFASRLIAYYLAHLFKMGKYK